MYSPPLSLGTPFSTSSAANLQEKRFNPYYTLVGQHLCRLSKSHQFTMQYCLWDFLRDLGETNVGGAEVLKIGRAHV